MIQKDLKKKIKASQQKRGNIASKIKCLIEHSEDDISIENEVGGLVNYTYQMFRSIYVIQHHNALEEHIEDAFIRLIENSYC